MASPCNSASTPVSSVFEGRNSPSLLGESEETDRGTFVETVLMEIEAVAT